MILRLFILALLIAPVWAIVGYYEGVIRPGLVTDLALKSVNGGKDEASFFTFVQRYANWPQFAAIAWTLLSAFVCFRKYTRSNYIKYEQKESAE